jgi:excisionase family DNA binding protein
MRWAMLAGAVVNEDWKSAKALQRKPNSKRSTSPNASAFVARTAVSGLRHRPDSPLGATTAVTEGNELQGGNTVEVAMNPMLTVRETAQTLRTSTATVYALCQRGLLRHSRVGVGRGTIRIRTEDLLAYLQTRTAGGDEVPEAPAPRLRLKHLKV